MRSRFDTAVFIPGAGTYVFADDVVWRYAPGRRHPDRGYPRPITKEFPGTFPRRVDAALVDPARSLLLFRGDRYIRYDLARGRPLLGFPRRYADDWPGVFPDRIDAAVHWGPDLVYLFHGDAYTSFSPGRGRARPGYPKPIALNWPGLSGGPVRAALRLPDGHRLLVTDSGAQAYAQDGRPVDPEGFVAPVMDRVDSVARQRSSEGPVLRSPRLLGSPARAELEQVAAGELRLGRPYDPTYPVPIRSQGPAVKEIQRSLIDLGWPLPRFGADGRYGNETYATVLAYKRRHNVPSDTGYLDGIAGPKMIAHIDASLPLRPCPPARPSSGALAEAGAFGAEAEMPGEAYEVPDVQPPAPGVPLFPTAVTPVLIPDRKLQAALAIAVAAVESRHRLTPGSFPIPFAIAEVTDTRPFALAGHRENEMDYIASEAKVQIMFAAYALRDLARRFATTRGITRPADLFAQLTAEVTPLLRSTVPRIASATNISDRHRDASYSAALAAKVDAAGPASVDFTPAFRSDLEQMIVASDNSAAGRCVRAIGYAYLNGVLQACGLFDAASDTGLWEAADFHGGDPPFTATRWPSVRVPVANDRDVGQAGTTRSMVELLSLLAARLIIDPAACDEMLGHLHRAAVPPTQVDRVFAREPGILRGNSITHNKIGIGPLNREPNEGRLAFSEVSILNGPIAAGRRYVVAWQNFVDRDGAAWHARPGAFIDIATIIRDTVTEYEKPAVAPEAQVGDGPLGDAAGSMQPPLEGDDFFLKAANTESDLNFLSAARPGNKVQPLVDGSAFFPAVEEAIADANESVYCTFWAIYPDTPLMSTKVRDALKVTDWQSLLAKIAREKGVKVRIITSDFDPVLDNEGHQRTWMGFNKFIAQAVTSGLTADQFQIFISLHPAAISGGIGDLVDKAAKPVLQAIIKQLNDKKLAGLENSPGLWRLVKLLNSGRVEMIAKPAFSASPASYHQKTILIDNQVGFVGGINISDFYQNTPQHLGDHRAHDAFCRVEGPVVTDIERNFVGRWNDESPRFAAFVTAANNIKLGKYQIKSPLAISNLTLSKVTPPNAGNALAQLHRTVCGGIVGTPPLIAPQTDRDDIKRTYEQVISRANEFVYIENQYLRTTDLADWVISRFKANGNLQVIIVVPVLPEELEEGKGDRISLKGVDLEHQTLTKLQTGLGRNVGLYSLVQNSSMPAGTPAAKRGLSSFGSLRIYPHSKILIVDDVFASIGSANVNPRSFQLDSEVDLGWYEPSSVKAFREQLWREHLGSPTGSLFATWKPADYVKQWEAIASSNSKTLPERRQGFVVPHSVKATKGSPDLLIPDWLT